MTDTSSTIVNRTLRRLPNSAYRVREYLTEKEVDRLIEAERAGREDNAKQIWQLLSMELWYRNARSMGVAA